MVPGGFASDISAAFPSTLPRRSLRKVMPEEGAGVSLISLLYVSSASWLLSIDELRGILDSSVRNNALNGVTGILLYAGGNFMQLLEGPEDRVLATLERIRKNPCHKGLIVLLQSNITQRAFVGHSMAFRETADLTQEQARHFSEFLKHGELAADFNSHALAVQRLLLGFRENMR
jgi:hypothetical protein